MIHGVSLYTRSKTFKSESQYEQHLQSKKHKVTEAEFAAAPPKPASSAAASLPQKKPQSSAAAASSSSSVSAAGGAAAAKADDAVFGDMDDADDDGEDGYDSDEDASKALPVTACLFCSHQSESLAANVQHMTDAHSFFVPYVEYLQDLEGFIQYLGYKVGLGRVCIYCNGRGRARFASGAAAASTILCPLLSTRQ
jgi:pre-60S factor REI1